MHSATETRAVDFGTGVIGGGHPLVFIAGPCVIESAEHALAMARQLRDLCAAARAPFIFKASYDKANRSSHESFRGPGLTDGLAILRRIKEELGVAVLTDVHRFEEIAPAAAVADVLQVPAFLCRQTDFVMDVARAARVINIKKGQFLAPWDIENVVAKARAAGNENILLTERGTSFGYNNLVADMRSLVVLRRTGCPVVFDATHSVQLPGGRGKASGGQREFVLPLARAAAAVGVDGIFAEVHDNPDQALSDGPNMLTPEMFAQLVIETQRITGC
ncbi:MAG: 3-deoxy-8-phosphooctulonate synthase [Candidatus Sumerlaeia bacterium]|nr:3-deoxy-8-phosphooctulonate synthase [Candidatus Sumerlaeia bacterium]